MTSNSTIGIMISKYSYILFRNPCQACDWSLPTVPIGVTFFNGACGNGYLEQLVTLLAVNQFSFSLSLSERERESKEIMAQKMINVRYWSREREREGRKWLLVLFSLPFSLFPSISCFLLSFSPSHSESLFLREKFFPSLSLSPHTDALLYQSIKRTKNQWEGEKGREIRGEKGRGKGSTCQ